MVTKIDRKEKIVETEFTIGWLEKTLQDALNTKATFTGYTDKRIGLGQGFLSAIVKIKVDWSDQDAARQTGFVVKAPTLNTLMNLEEQVDMPEEEIAELNKNLMKSNFIAMVHNTEVELYHVIKSFDVQMKIPLCYHGSRFESADEPGALILEDLSDRGLAKTPANGLTVDSVYQVLEAFAKLHAWCFESTEKWHDNPRLSVTFGKFAQEMGHDVFLQMIKATAEYVPEAFPGVLEETMQRCRDAKIIFDYTSEQLTDLFDRPEKVNTELGMPDVLVHGDLWISNMMFEKDEDGNATDTVLKIIDWQIAHSGCFAEDLAFLLLSSCTAEVRRANTDRFMRHYYDALTKLMGRQPPFTLEQLKQAYKKLFLSAAYNVFPILPMFAKQKDQSLLGPNPEEAKMELIQRTKAVLEDCLAIHKELNG